ncbi:short-chain dehydrogenase/reductase [Colletotrichum lupini]|uniref:Short-chain dehydrogenase/reductase n=1 Tax=Colletotrichum lupini TaxID=145971 RepID=A0A9Q8SDS1_9PEZI|nr:short-chain dehydrogenase/reductase [Colletotrichum lupini]UQC75198.1 short-chain dehydrogenase/reductase [Colletotrichum lupini]
MDWTYAAFAGVLGARLFMASLRENAKQSRSLNVKHLPGKVILITGGNTGLGKQAAIELARLKPAQLWLTGRDAIRLRDAAADIRKQVDDAPPINVLTLDLASFKSIRSAAETFLSQCQRLDVLMLNAGVMSLPAGMTQDGYEIQFGTNHVGHALLTKLLEPALLAAKQDNPRVVVLSSRSHRDVPPGGIKWDSLKTSGTDVFILKRYGQSKLANALYARELAKRRPWLRVAAVHPGVVRGTDIQASATGIPFVLRCLISFIRHWITISLEDGVKTQVWASIDDQYPSGEYFEPVGKPGLASKYAMDDRLALKMWDWTESELEAHGF